jgi:hypothetical protein
MSESVRWITPVQGLLFQCPYNVCQFGEWSGLLINSQRLKLIKSINLICIECLRVVKLITTTSVV